MTRGKGEVAAKFYMMRLFVIYTLYKILSGRLNKR
jgi:hypothetical protein